MGNAIEITNLCKNYKDFALDRINLTMPTGYIMGIIGENGAGKSTLIKSMLGIIKKDEGQVILMGKPFDSDKKEMKERIGLVLDENNFPLEATPGDLKRIMSTCYKSWDSNRYDKLLTRFNLPYNKKIKEFSKGMKMKNSIAVALAHDSRLLILDEATSGLDPIAREEMLDIFREFILDEDHSIILSSHILSDLEKICDYITFIHNGKMVFSEEKDTLTAKYAVTKCTKENFKAIDDDAVISYKENEFGVEALVERAKVNPAFEMTDASIEDIMIYFVKENAR